MSSIDEFIARYTKEYDFYDQAARIVARLLEKELQATGIRSIVTPRAKSISRLKTKCLQREKKHGSYVSVDQIFEDIKDLSGVRIALYFPGQRSQVEGIVERLFHVADKRTDFPVTSDRPFTPRFSGYAAIHYTAQLRDHDLSDDEKRYAAARIEIQIATVLMHAWSEVEHDLVYKPLSGELSHDEYAALDQLNGLVLAGEIALETLQKANQERVAAKGRKIANHYDLAVHLLGRAAEITQEPVNDAGLGEVDVLFDLISELDINTVEKLAPYLDTLHGNVELRPLSQQIIETLLTEDESRYAVYNSVRSRRTPTFYEPDAEDLNIVSQVGNFISHWIDFEKALRGVGPYDNRKPLIVNMRLLTELNLLDDDSFGDLERLRRMRNNLVHGVETPSAADLADAAQRLDEIRKEITQRYGENNRMA
jgi:ppGpp synthetase/RelA/SpoT-type nucleotidyltranferase